VGEAAPQLAVALGSLLRHDVELRLHALQLHFAFLELRDLRANNPGSSAESKESKKE
jgi:hypothetical protein